MAGTSSSKNKLKSLLQGGSSGTDTFKEGASVSIKGESGNKSTSYMWKVSGQHLYGHFSMAVVQANIVNEDRCQLESEFIHSLKEDECRGVFVGVYDGHQGSGCSQHVLESFLTNLKYAIASRKGVNMAVIQDCYRDTENQWIQHVRSKREEQPLLAAMGSCCLVGVIHKNTLFVANSGNSRAILARLPKTGSPIEVVKLSESHNLSIPEVGQQLQGEHPEHLNLINYWKQKGLIRQDVDVARAIGDLYLKNEEFNKYLQGSNYHMAREITTPILRLEPTVYSCSIDGRDKFAIFGSAGLWNHLSDEEAVGIVRKTSPSKAAKAILKEALQNTAIHAQLIGGYKAFKKLETGEEFGTTNRRRPNFDDISVLVIFFNKLQPPAL